MTNEDYIRQAELIEPGKDWRLQIQYHQLWATARVKCFCGAELHFMDSFRCLYCGEFFCARCAEVHFGQTHRDWMKSRHLDALKQMDGEKMVEYYKQPETRTMA